MKEIFQKFKMYGVKTFFSYLIIESSYRFWTNFVLGSYSQEREDLFIFNRLQKKQGGFYVDVGANDPDRFSNTKFFYRKGWRGINIEPDQELFRVLTRRRKRDINVNIGVGPEKSAIVFYKFIPHTLSTFSLEEAEKYKEQGFQLIGTELIGVDRLESILSQSVPNGIRIDFMSIDTEGFDMHVLQSNDWERFRPRIICIESVTHTVDGRGNKKEDDHEAYLKSIGYAKIFDNGLNSIYEDGR